MIGAIWVLSIVATLIIADQKKRSILGFLFLALCTGPLAVLIVLLFSSAKKSFPSYPSANDTRAQLTQIKSDLLNLQQRIQVLETFLSAPVSEGESTGTNLSDSSASPESLEPSLAGPTKKEISAPEPVDREIDFGRNWLNKIGIAIFTLGVAFLISYTFKYFGPFFKIAFGYLVAAALFVSGARFEKKEKFMRFGRVLLGGGWAVTYFTTYAMYHFDASRILTSQGIDIALLVCVVIGMIGHVLRYQSESMMSVALFVAYLTTTVGKITSFTVIGCLGIAVLLLFLVYRFQWIRAFILGVVLTYAIHVFWVMPHIAASSRQAIALGFTSSDYDAFMNFIFLTGYWAVFASGMHILRLPRPEEEKILGASNFGNIALFTFLAYPLLMRLPQTHQFSIMLILGAVHGTLAFVMRHFRKEHLYTGDLIAAAFFLTAALPFRFAENTALLLWYLEIPFLLLAGALLREKVYRYLSYGLTVIANGWLFFLTVEGTLRAWVTLGKFVFWWQDFLFFWAAVMMGAAFFLSQKSSHDPLANDMDRLFDQVFSGLSVICFTFWILLVIRHPWGSIALAAEAGALFCVSAWMRLERFRDYAYLILLAMAGIFIFERVYDLTFLVKILLAVANVAIFFILYHFMRYLLSIKRLERSFENEETWLLGGGIVVFIAAIFKCLPWEWVSLSLVGGGLLLIIAGIAFKDKGERMGGLLLFALALGRIFLVDLAQVAVIFKIVTFLAIGIIFVGVSYGYNRYSVEQEQRKIK